MLLRERRGLLSAIFLLVASFFSARIILAAQVTQNYSVIVARPIVSTTTAILFSFRVGQSVLPSSSLVFTFDPAYTMPLSVTPSDGALNVDGGARVLGAVAGSGVYGYVLNTGNIVLTTPPDETISSGSTVQLLVGAEGGILTANATGTHLFTTSFYNAASELQGTIKALTIIANPIGVSASVSSTDIYVQVIKIKPELRIGAPYTNNDATYYLTARNGGAVLFTEPTLSTADEAGHSTDTVLLAGLSNGSYDMGIKTHQHLTRVLRAVPLSSAMITPLNFTDPANGPADGDQVLLGGDIDGAGTGPASLGDDTINSIDLSIMLARLDDSDPTGNEVRPNVNQDPVVNSVDMSILLKNLDKQGDK